MLRGMSSLRQSILRALSQSRKWLISGACGNSPRAPGDRTVAEHPKQVCGVGRGWGRRRRTAGWQGERRWRRRSPRVEKS